MGVWLREHHTLAVELFDEASDVLGYDLAELCQQGPAETLNETIHSQPALFVVGIAAARAYSEAFPSVQSRVVATAGLSLGEITAVCYAGGMQFADGVRLVQARGEAMQACADAVDSGMASVLGLDFESLQSVCDDALGANEDGLVLMPANLLCPGNIAVSGHAVMIERFQPLALEAGAMKVVPLSVAGAFHTSLMSQAVERLRDALASITMSDCRLPVFSNVDGKPHTSADEIRDLLARQVVNPVQWEASIRAMIAAGVDGFIEAGTGRVLRGTIKRIDRKMATQGFGDGS